MSAASIAGSSPNSIFGQSGGTPSGPSPNPTVSYTLLAVALLAVLVGALIPLGAEFARQKSGPVAHPSLVEPAPFRCPDPTPAKPPCFCGTEKQVIPIKPFPVACPYCHSTLFIKVPPRDPGQTSDVVGAIVGSQPAIPVPRLTTPK